MTTAARPSLVTHLKRALGWNLARVEITETERVTLEAHGVRASVVQRYAAWRRSLLLVAVFPTVIVLGLGLLDVVDGALDGLMPLGVGMELAWFAAMVGVVIGCVRGLRAWTRPGTSAHLLVLAWAAAFIIPVVYALLPPALLYQADAAARAAAAGEQPERLDALLELAFEIALSGSTVLMLLPAVLSVIPGAVNGCLRVKSLLPGAQLPGWLLVCSAPMFLLFWLVLLVLANQALGSPLLVLGVLLWAGSPILYAVRGSVFVRSQIGAEEASRIARVKRAVGLLALVGIGMALYATATTRVAGMTLLGADEDGALSTKLEELAEATDEVSLEHVSDALESATSLVYALDLSSWQLLIDVLAKLLLTTAVFAHLVLRATMAAWSNDKSLRSRGESADFDSEVSAVGGAITSGPQVV